MLEACWQSHAGAAEEGEQGEGGALRQVCIGAEGGERGGGGVRCGACEVGWRNRSKEGCVCAVARTYLGGGRGARRGVCVLWQVRIWVGEGERGEGATLQ